MEERKRKAEAQGQGRPAKRQKGGKGGAVEAGSHLVVEGEDDDEQSDLVLMYNTI